MTTTNFSMNAIKNNVVSKQQAQAQQATRNVVANASNGKEEIIVVQTLRAGATYVYGISGLYFSRNRKTPQHSTLGWQRVDNPTRDNLLGYVADVAAAMLAERTKADKKAPIRLVMNDNMAIKHFAMLAAQKNGEDPVARMCRGFNYSDEVKASLANYVEAVRKFLDVTGQRLYVETYRSQFYWDIKVPEEIKDKLQQGATLKFNGNSCENIPGIEFVQKWHTQIMSLKLHIDMQNVRDENGNLVRDDEGKIVTKASRFAVARPTVVGEGGAIVPKADKVQLVVTLANYAKANAPKERELTDEEVDQLAAEEF